MAALAPSHARRVDRGHGWTPAGVEGWRLSDGEVHYLWWYIQGSIMEPHVRWRLRHAWGMCGRHAWGALLAEVPLQARVQELGETGVPVVLAEPDSPAGQALRGMAEEVERLAAGVAVRLPIVTD